MDKILHKTRFRRSEAKIIKCLGIHKESSKIKKNSDTRDANDAYDEKCKDQRFRPNDISRSRFIEIFVAGIRRKSLVLSNLMLSHSCVIPMGHVLARHSKLVYLDLSLNQLRDEGARLLGSILSDNSQIMFLDLRSNFITGGGMADLFRSLSANQHLVGIDLGAVRGMNRNQFGAVAAQALRVLFCTNKALTILLINSCGISSQDCEPLGDAITRSALTHLDFGGNRIGDAGIRSLLRDGAALAMIEVLNLSYCDIGDVGGAEVCSHLPNSFVVDLDLSYNRLTSVFFESLTEIDVDRLRRLSLRGNHIGHDCHELVRTFVSKCKLLELDLSHNLLGDSVVEGICTGLADDSPLRVLCLEHVACGDEGAVAISRRLNIFRDVNLAMNLISDKSGPILAEAALSAPRLTRLCLRENLFGDVTAMAFCPVFAGNHRLTDLDLSRNDETAVPHLSVAEARDHRTVKLAELAEDAVEEMKESERVLESCRADVAKTKSAVLALRAKVEEKTKLRDELKAQKAMELAESEAELTKMQEEATAVAEERSQVSDNLAAMKARAEDQEARMVQQLHAAGTKRAQVDGRLSRAQGKLMTAQAEHKQLMGVLGRRYDELRERLRFILQEAVSAKQKLLEPPPPEAPADAASVSVASRRLQQKKARRKGKKGKKAKVVE